MDIFDLLKVEKIDLYSFNRETGKYEYKTFIFNWEGNNGRTM